MVSGKQHLTCEEFSSRWSRVEVRLCDGASHPLTTYIYVYANGTDNERCLGYLSVYQIRVAQLDLNFLPN